MKFDLSLLTLLFAPCLASASAPGAKNDFIQAMRSVRIDNEKKARKGRLFASILSSAKHVRTNQDLDSNLKRSLGYYDDQNDDAYGGYGFDLSSYSLKYAGCSAISTYSDDMAADEDSYNVFETDQYVVFRFCPSDSCSDSSTYGCLYDYGEYMVPIATWMELMAEYREEEFDSYCEYCEACGGNYYNNGDDANNGRKLYYDDAAAGDDAAAAGDDAAAAGDDAAEDDAYDCSYAAECKGYQDVCVQNDDAVDVTNFFECKQFDVSDDLTLYVGPHCAADKSTIVLGAYKDEYCSQYTSKYDIATITDSQISSDALLEYYNTDCIPCKESDLAFNKGDGDDEDGDDVTEVCENLYNYAAKCNRHIGGVTAESYQSSQQEDNEYTVCSFIASVVTGSYDEFGYIYVDPFSFASDNEYNEYSANAIRKGVVSTDQFLGLTILTLIIFGMMLYAAVLHLQIQSKSAFDSKDVVGQDEVKRQNSGIMMARSTTVDSSSGYQPPQSTGQLA